MKIIVDRYLSNSDVTLSKGTIDGDHVADGLEDEYRRNKVPGETRIPAGKYKLGLRKVGGFHKRYAGMFPWHRGMLEVKDVPNFKYILIHIGNWDRDTDGCLLLGSADEKAMAVWLSKATYTRFYKRVIDAVERGSVTIEYRDNDGAVG